MMRLSSSSTLLNQKPACLIWIQTSFLGDIVLTTGAMALARKHFPETKQILITNATGKAALTGEQLVDEIIVYDKKKLGAYAAMRRVKRSLYDAPPAETIILQVHRSFRSSLLSRYLGFGTVTYRQSSLSWLADAHVERVAHFHEAVRIGLLLEPLGVLREEIKSIKPVLLPQPFESTHRRTVGVAPGSVWGTKRWPKEKFAELVAGLLDFDRSLDIVLLGTDAERQQTDFITNKLSSQRVQNLAGKTSLDELKRTIANLALLIANDSSPIHFASAYDTPTVAIFGATIPELGFGPLASKRAVAGVQLNCRPCSDHGPQVCPLKHFRCMNELTVDQILTLSTHLLGPAEHT